jgi:SAM-dependent methyltransferase
MTTDYLKRTVCPVCAAPVTDSAPVVQSAPTAESLSFGEHGAFLSGYTTQRVFFTYHRCNACGGLYCPVYFTQAQLDQLYSRQAENMADVPLAARVATQHGYIEILARHSSLKGNYLELGPDIGLFAEICADRGDYSKFHLYEPNREVHPALAARFRGRDALVSAERYQSGQLPKGSVNTAVAIHVVDHLINPAELLSELYDDLAPGGVLFLVTHNEASLLAKVLGRRWPPYTLQHPLLYSPTSISRLLERCGFQVREVVLSQNYFPLTHLIRAGFTVAGLERLVPRNFDHPFSLGLRLGNIATVACKPAS